MTSLFFAPEDSVLCAGVARQYAGVARVYDGIQTGVKELRSRPRNATTKMQDLRLSIFAPLSLLLNGIQNACIVQVKVLPQRTTFFRGNNVVAPPRRQVGTFAIAERGNCRGSQLQLSIYIPLVMQA